MRNLVSAVFAAAIWIAASCFASAAPTGTGTAVGVDPAAEATLNNVPRTLIVGSDVTTGDTVITGTSGEVQLLFSDQTKLVVGPNSSLLIEAYLLRNDTSAQKLAIDALSGSFRFITGTSAKSAYRIDTPTGTIGVRGTGFDFTVDPKLGTTLVLFHGAVRMCNLDDKCINVSQTCGVGRISDSGAAAMSRGQQTAENLRAGFQYVQSDQSLMPAFQSAGSGNCLQPTTNATPAPRTATVAPSKPPSRTPPRHVTPRPPTHVTVRPVVNPCDNYYRLSGAQRRALRDVCLPHRGGGYNNSNDGPPPSLIGNPFRDRGYGRGNSDGGSSFGY